MVSTATAGARVPPAPSVAFSKGTHVRCGRRLSNQRTNLSEESIPQGSVFRRCLFPPPSQSQEVRLVASSYATAALNISGRTATGHKIKSNRRAIHRPRLLAAKCNRSPYDHPVFTPKKNSAELKLHYARLVLKSRSMNRRTDTEYCIVFYIVFSFYWKKTLLTERNKWDKLV